MPHHLKPIVHSTKEVIMKHPFVFKPQKSIEAILYTIPRLINPTFHRLAKIMYFADRIHLEKYGRFICGDRYVAMKHGPVPSSTYELLKRARDNDLSRFSKIPLAKQAFVIQDQSIVKALRTANLDLLSDSDIECLNQAIEKYGHLSFQQLTQLSYDSAWHAADENDCITVEHIIATLRNNDYLLDYLRETCPQ
jgi:uncharacterized phage-associated protein